MSNEALFIGLGQIGMSIALNFARSDANISLIAHDSNKEQVRRAKKLGVINRFVSNPRKASKSADIVILDVPPSSVRDHLAMLGKQLKPDGIVIDTTPARSLAIQWAEELLPGDHHYLGVTPILGAYGPVSEPAETNQPRIDLFQDSLMAIVIPKSGSEEAVASGLDLVRLLGSTPFFMDAYEHDGLTTSVEWLPRLISAAILQEMDKAGNRQEIQRMAGTTFATITSPGSEKPTLDSDEIRSLNQEILRLKLRHFIGELQTLDRVLADESGNSLNDYIASAHAARARWLSDRHSEARIRDGRSPERIPKRRSMMAKLLGFHPSDDQG